MKTNIGHVEMLIRLFSGIALADLSIDQATYGHTNIITSALAVLLLVTAVTGFCPLYALLGIHRDGKNNTHSHSKNS